MVRAIDIVQVKREIQAGKLAVELKNNDVLLTDKKSGEAVCISTLTPPNDLMEALEAINNAAVAYIEGGPYENDLPGVELAVEIDRLSRDFVRPPNEALPVLVNDEPDREYIDYICPRCKEIISQRRRGQRMETVYKCKFHDNCGQRVDWNNSQPYRRPPEGEEDTQ